MSRWLLRNRVLLVVMLNAVADIACLVGASVHGEPIGRALYACALLGLSSAPLTLLPAFTSRYILLALFMATYFLHFGAVDLQVMLVGEEIVSPRMEVLTQAEIAILIAAVLILACYMLVARAIRPGDPARIREWPARMALVAGLSLWLIGTCATVYYQVFITPERTNFATARGLAALGPMLTFVVMLGQLMQPLGLLVIAYGYARFRGPLWTTLMVCVVLIQMGVGFVIDVKGVAFMPGVMVIVVRTLVDNRPPLAWVLAAVAALVFLFPVYQAYRVVTGQLGYDRLQAFTELDRVFDLALQFADKAADGQKGQQPQNFVERAYVKPNVEQVIAHAGTDLPFLYGASLVDIPLSFVPRILLPDKQHLVVGQLYNRSIGKNDDDTYISISHLGEFYWNFGWPGVVLGMVFTGLLLGFVGTRFGLEQGVTLTRVMVLLATVQNLCLGFESDMANTYSVWLRSMAAIFLLHQLVAKPASVLQRGGLNRPDIPEHRRGPRSVPLAAPARFPNVMR